MVRPEDVPTVVPPVGAVFNIAGTNVFQNLMATIPGARVGDLVTYSGTCKDLDDRVPWSFQPAHPEPSLGRSAGA